MFREGPSLRTHISFPDALILLTDVEWFNDGLGDVLTKTTSDHMKSPICKVKACLFVLSIEWKLYLNAGNKCHVA